MLKKLAFLFPGQGSQSVGMGRDFFDAFPLARETLAEASDIAGIDLAGLCFNGPAETLKRTANLQPAIMAVNLAIWAVLDASGLRPDLAAGHSLGEFSALCAARVLSTSSALRLVSHRAALMEREARRNPGVMAAVVGLPRPKVEALVAVARGRGEVAVANYNGAEQTVVTGIPEAVEALGGTVTEKGGRLRPLPVSGAWHSPLMAGAREEMARALAAEPFAPPECAVVLNVTADFAADPDQIRRTMAEQLCSPVRWHESMLRINDQSPDAFLEVGPGKVLTGLLKRTLLPESTTPVYSVGSVAEFETVLAKVG